MFKVNSISKANKAGYMVFNISFEGNEKNQYTFVRRSYKETSKGTNHYSVVIKGYRINYTDTLGVYTVDDVVQEYETQGKNVTSTIKDSIKSDPHFPEVPEVQEEIPDPVPNPEAPVIPKGEIRHSKYKTIKTCVENDIPVYLAGPAGSGKNHTLEQVAKDLGMDFHFTNSVQQEYKLTGFIDAGGVYHETEFYKAFTNGGLFFLDEMDASIPEVLVLLNAAIANGYFEFPNGKVDANENFRVVAAGNTVGSGADEDYTGRMVLDQATLDRFVIIEFDYDTNVEFALSKGNKALVDFIHELREAAKSQGVRATFSYRCIMQVTKLESAKLGLAEIIKIAVVKGLDKDTVKALNSFKNYNKYTQAFYEVCKVA